MTIQKARKLLGVKSEGISDKDLLEYINATDKMLTHLMKLALKENSLNQVVKDDTV